MKYCVAILSMTETFSAVKFETSRATYSSLWYVPVLKMAISATRLRRLVVVTRCAAIRTILYLRTRSIHSLARAPHPTLGSPTIPHLSDVPKRPIKGPGPSASAFFFGGIFLLDLTPSPTCRDESALVPVRGNRPLNNAHWFPARLSVSFASRISAGN